MKKLMPLPLAACFVAALTLSVGIASPVHAERPNATKLLPESTLAYVRIADVPDLVDKIGQTAGGRLAQDKKIAPIIGQLYGSAAEAFKPIEEQIGLSLDELLRIPQGEVCVALVAPDEGIPALVAIIDAGEHIGSARKLIKRGEDFAAERGVPKVTERLGKTDLNIFEPPGRRNIRAGYIDREQTIVIFSNVDVAKDLVTRWDGKADKKDKTFADNDDFVTIMSRSRGTKDERPQVTWFVDPIELIAVGSRGNSGAQVGLALLPAIGLDGLKAVGGSIIYAAEEFDQISHLHILLDSPRTGVIEMLALKSGDTTPEPWIPPDVASYWTMNWDVDKTYSTFRSLYDSFAGEGALDDELKNRISERTGVDFQKDVLDELEGRITWTVWMQTPATINSGANLIGVKVKDATAFQKTLDTVIGNVAPNLEKKTFGGTSYYQGEARGPRIGAEGDENRVQIQVRPPEPCIGIIGDYVVFSDSAQLMQQAIITKNDARKTLANELDFKVIAEKVKSQSGDTRPGALMFNRPEVGLRTFYELASADQTRDFLSSRAEENRLFRALHEAMRDNPLPPFAEVAKYLAPTGGMITNDETGFHVTGFSLKRD